MQDILIIIPTNIEARRAFYTVAQSAKRGDLDPLHAQYVCITGDRPIIGYETRDVESGKTEDKIPSSPPTIILTCYYRVNFVLPAVRTGPTWVYISILLDTVSSI